MRGHDELQALCLQMLSSVGEDPTREGLIKTPDRFARAFADLTMGYQQTQEEVVGDALFEASSSQMVVVQKMEFYSLCEHHLLPFFGHAHVAYLPNKKIIGLSKIPRIVNMYARRLQVQERLCDQVAKAIEEVVQPFGVACVIEASHLCMMMRGVQVQSGMMTTSSMRGDFLTNHATRAEFLSLLRN